MLASTSSKQGLNREAWAALLRVRTRPECPEDNLRELTWDSNQNRGIDREREKRERERRNFPMKSSDLRHCWLLTEQRTWSNTRWELASCGLAYHLLEAERQVGNSQSWKVVISAPETASPTKLLASSQLLTKSSWDPGWLTYSGGVAVRDQFPRRDTWPTWDGASTEHPGNRVAGTGKVIRHTTQPGESVLVKHWVTWAAQTWEGDKMQALPSLYLCGVPKNLNLSGLDLGRAHNPGTASDSSQQSNLEPKQCKTGKAHTPWARANPVWRDTASAHQCCLQWPSLPTAWLNCCCC